MRKAAVVFITLIAAASTTARTITVDNDAPADFNNIQAAIDDANDGDTVEIQSGTYTGDGNRDIDFLGKAITVTATDPNDPNIVAATIIDCNGSAEDLHRGFYFHNGEDANSVLAGLTITNGCYGDGGGINCSYGSPTIVNCAIIANRAGSDGGGISCADNCSPIIDNCQIADNLVGGGRRGNGGGIYCVGGSPTIIRCNITGNALYDSSDTCYGVYCESSARLIIDSCTISENAGGIYISDADVSLTNSTVSNNLGSGVYYYGSIADLSNCNITQNSGSGISCYETTLTISNCAISQNSDRGVYCDESTATITDCTINDNTTTEYYGSGFYSTYGGRLTVHSSVFRGNSSTLGAAVFSMTDFTGFTNCVFVGNYGGGLHFVGNNCVLTHCTIAGNFSTRSLFIGAYGSKLLANSIIWDTVEIPKGGSGGITHCDIRGSWPGEGNIDADPCFADPNNGDFHLKSQGGRWEPNEGQWVIDGVTSPCIDAGDPAKSVGTEPFPNGGVRNMGAFGGTAEASKSYFGKPPCETIVAGDINGDCEVNSKDFAFMGSHWSEGMVTPPMQEHMVLIPGGEFDMGDSFSEGDSDESPVHQVHVDSFYMSRHEITNQQYCDYLNSAKFLDLIAANDYMVWGKMDLGAKFPYCDTFLQDSDSSIHYSGRTFAVTSGRENHAMVQVSWYGAAAYCNWRSQVEGYEQCYDLWTWECDFSKKGYRLPTEAEWEYAARGAVAGRRFPWGDTISHNEANFCSRDSYPYDLNPTPGYHPAYSTGSEPYTAPLGSFAANDYGLYDMAGNVWEWCNDGYSGDYYNATPYDNPTGPTGSSDFVIRGGSWDSSAKQCRIANRGPSWPDVRFDCYGIRVVLDLN